MNTRSFLLILMLMVYIGRAHSQEQTYAEMLGYPVVVKPADRAALWAGIALAQRMLTIRADLDDPVALDVHYHAALVGADTAIGFLADYRFHENPSPDPLSGQSPT